MIFVSCFELFIQVVEWTEAFSCERCRDAGVCETVDGTLQYSVMSKGYNPVVTIPRGACYVNVTEAADTDNVLGRLYMYPEALNQKK